MSKRIFISIFIFDEIKILHTIALSANRIFSLSSSVNYVACLETRNYNELIYSSIHEDLHVYN